MIQLIQRYKDHFLVRACCLLLIYLLFTNSFLMPRVNAFLTENTANFAAWLVTNLWHKNASILEIESGYKWFVCAQNGGGVKIAHPCNAFELYCLYLGFLVAMSGISLRRKWAFAVLGVVVIYGFNALRVVALFLIQGRWPQVFDFMHKYLFQASAYLLIFGLWYWLLRKHGKKS